LVTYGLKAVPFKNGLKAVPFKNGLKAVPFKNGLKAVPFKNLGFSAAWLAPEGYSQQQLFPQPTA